MERLDNSKLSPLQRHIVDKMAMAKGLRLSVGPERGKQYLQCPAWGLALTKIKFCLHIPSR